MPQPKPNATSTSGPEPQRGKRYGLRVKSGCFTCKIRHVKCDEARPACQRCTKTGRTCDGYATITAPSNIANITHSLPRPVASMVSGSAREKRSISFYLHHTSQGLSGYYDTSFWEGLVVQAAMAEPALKHAIIALGALHENFTYQEYDTTNKQFAITQYSKAIQSLRKSLASGAQQPLTALLTCILFVVFDSMQGSFESALIHLQSGLAILVQLQIKELGMAQSLMEVFTRLTIQAMLHLESIPLADRKKFARRFIVVLQQETDVPKCFVSLEEARKVFNKIMIHLQKFFLLLDYSVPYSEQRNVEPLRKMCLNLFASWDNTFDAFIQTRGVQLRDRELRGVTLLKLQILVTKIMASSCFPTALSSSEPLYVLLRDREHYKQYTGNFKSILKLASSICADLGDKKYFNFSADFGIIAPLHYCSINCPDRATRIEMLDLIQSCSRREGMWDNAITAGLIRNSWKLRELE